MKKLVVIMLFVMGALAANAQRSPVKASDLPKGVSDSINKEYPGYIIKETSKVVSNNVTTYEVEISKGMTDKTLTFDNTGKSLKSKGSDMDKSKNSTTPEPGTSPSPSTTPDSHSSSSPSSSPSPTPSTSPSSPTTPPQR
jgi:hypothetical protein